MQPDMCCEAFSRHFGVFDVSPQDPTKRSSKKLAEGAQSMRAHWTATRKPGDVRLIDALASGDGPSRGHSRAFSLVDGAESFETYSKNLNEENKRPGVDANN